MNIHSSNITFHVSISFYRCDIDTDDFPFYIIHCSIKTRSKKTPRCRGIFLHIYDWPRKLPLNVAAINISGTEKANVWNGSAGDLIVDTVIFAKIKILIVPLLLLFLWIRREKVGQRMYFYVWLVFVAYLLLMLYYAWLFWSGYLWCLSIILNPVDTYAYKNRKS